MNLDIKLLSLLLLLMMLFQSNIFGNTINTIKVKNKEYLKDEVLSENIDVKSLSTLGINDLLTSSNSALDIQEEKIINSEKPIFMNKLGDFLKKNIVNPLKYMSLTSLFGKRNHPVLKKIKNHDGIDLKASIGTEVLAFTDGIIKYAGYMKGYGKIVIISHNNGYETRYAHLSKINVKKNQVINAGQKIANSGNSGQVSGPNLHFEIRKNNIPLNPLDYLNV